MKREELLSLISYDPDTGVFTRPDGEVAGSVDKDGYVIIQLGGRLENGGERHRAHRLAWFLTYGVWPDGEVDHRNGKRSDNRLKNLREATSRQNKQNSKSKTDRGVKGISRSRGKWMAQIRIEGRRLFLGRFEDERSAHAAYVAAAKAHHGEFARAA